MCSNCHNLLSLLRGHNAERQREEHGERIAARARENRPWKPEEKAACYYCKNEAEPGRIETDNNGPIVNCPVCNSDSVVPGLEDADPRVYYDGLHE
jgi:hypothetical protein